MNDLPNIILITADQWRGDCLGMLGGPHPVMTPHMNQLAAEGAHFTQAYADCPVCMPQRASMMTGQSASRFGMPRNFMGGTERTPIDRSRSLPGRLTREAGYETRAIGKMHFAPQRARYGFDHVTLFPDDYINWLEETEHAGQFRGHGLGGNEVYPTTSTVPERYSHTHWIVEQAVRFLYQRDPDCPFFLWIIFEAPHSPFDPPSPYDRMYDNFTIPPPVHGNWAGDALPPALQRMASAHMWSHLNDEMILESRRRYYGQITHIDYELGLLLGELKSRGIYDDTAILFNSDHGEHLGDHGLFAKSTYVKGSADVPFILKPPREHAISHPMSVDMPVLTTDVYPTLAELAGLEAYEEIDGISLMSVISDGVTVPRTICGEIESSSAFSFDGQFKYIFYPEGGIEHLFDVQEDPSNLHNLAHQPTHHTALTRLRQTLIAHLQRFNRPWVHDGLLSEITVDTPAYPSPFSSAAAMRGPMRYGRGY